MAAIIKTDQVWLDQTTSSAVGAPAIIFGADSLSGLYRIGTNNIGLTINGTKLLDMSSGAVAITGTLSTTGTLAAGNTTITGTLSTTGTLAAGNTTITGTLSTTGLISPSQTVGIVGTTTNNSAQAGSIGEYIESAVAAVTSGATSGVALNATSISLTAGDWDVSGVVIFANAGATTYQYSKASISTTTGTLGTQSATTVVTQALGYVGDNYTAPANPTPVVRVLISSTTTIYLVGVIGYSGSTFGIGGTIRARRVR